MRRTLHLRRVSIDVPLGVLLDDLYEGLHSPRGTATQIANGVNFKGSDARDCIGRDTASDPNRPKACQGTDVGSKGSRDERRLGDLSGALGVSLIRKQQEQADSRKAWPEKLAKEPLPKIEPLANHADQQALLESCDLAEIDIHVCPIFCCSLLVARLGREPHHHLVYGHRRFTPDPPA